MTILQSSKQVVYILWALLFLPITPSAVPAVPVKQRGERVELMAQLKKQQTRLQYLEKAYNQAAKEVSLGGGGGEAG